MKIVRISLEVLRDDYTSRWFQDMVIDCTPQEIQERVEKAIDYALKETGEINETRYERRARIFKK